LAGAAARLDRFAPGRTRGATLPRRVCSPHRTARGAEQQGDNGQDEARQESEEDAEYRPPARYAEDVEVAVYYRCLEAPPERRRTHGGPDAVARVHLRQTDGICSSP
jgi:hypothetical protein